MENWKCLYVYANMLDTYFFFFLIDQMILPNEVSFFLVIILFLLQFIDSFSDEKEIKIVINFEIISFIEMDLNFWIVY